MPNPIIPRNEVWEGSDLGYTLAQVVGRNATLLAEADIDTITVYVRDKTTGALIYTANVMVGGVVLNAPVKDDRWTHDDVGYNFIHYLDHDTVFATVAMEGGHVYRREYAVLTNNASGIIRIVGESLCTSSMET